MEVKRKVKCRFCRKEKKFFKEGVENGDVSNEIEKVDIVIIFIVFDVFKFL